MSVKVCYVCRGRKQVVVEKEVLIDSQWRKIQEKIDCKRCNATGRWPGNGVR